MNSAEIFTLALNLSAPWYIKDVQMSKAEGSVSGQIDIYIDFKRGAKFLSEQGLPCNVHDTSLRRWQHLNFFEHSCYIHARVPRIKDEDGKVTTVQVPWARSHIGFTLLFEAFSMLLIESEMPVKKAAKALNIYDTKLWRIFNHWVGKACDKMDLRDVESIGIDETSSKKGHNYVTIAVDLEKKQVIHATPGKDSTTIDRLSVHIEDKGGDAGNIKQASIDMSPAFISGIMTNFPNAKITFDKFHVNKLINDAMDSLRKAERKEIKELAGHKYLFLKNDDKLKAHEKEAKFRLLNSYPKLGEGYRLKQMFNDFWDMKDTKEASAYLAYWTDLVEESAIAPFMKAAKTIKAHWSGVINYIGARINNGILEGINSKIQLAKKRARGYRNMDNFINMIYFIAGKLKFDYPQYLA